MHNDVDVLVVDWDADDGVRDVGEGGADADAGGGGVGDIR